MLVCCLKLSSIHKLFDLQEFENFTNKSNDVLSSIVDWNDFAGLLNVMSVLNQVKGRNQNIGDFFEMLRKLIDVLLQFNIIVPEKCAIQVG